MKFGIRLVFQVVADVPIGDIGAGVRASMASVWKPTPTFLKSRVECVDLNPFNYGRGRCLQRPWALEGKRP